MNRLINLYKAAPHDKCWYSEARDWALGVAKKHKLTLEQVVGIIAVLSPGTTWDQNKRDTIKLIEQGADAVVCTYPRNKETALRIIAGERFVDITKGPKIRAFYDCILDPIGSQNPVIDRHAWKAYTGKQGGGAVSLTITRYRRAAAAYIRAAKKVGVPVARFQAVVWLNYKTMVGR